MKSQRSPRCRDARGFSLLEVMIASTLFAIVSAMGLAFLIDGTRASLRASSSILNDISQWGISSRLQLDSKVANGATIYASLASGDITVGGRRKAGDRGKVLVLSSSVIKNNNNVAQYEKVTGYSYDSTKRTLYRFEFDVPTADQKDTLENIITDRLAGLKLVPVTTNIESLDAGGPFVSRDTSNNNAATATFRLNQGYAGQRTQSSIVLEVSFLIRG